MKSYVLLLVLLSAGVHASTELKMVYLQFEDVYRSNDASRLEPWLANGYQLTETFRIPGVGSDTNEFSKQDLLAAMAYRDELNDMLRSRIDDIEIRVQSKKKFCAISTLHTVVIDGREIEGLETRTVCFKQRKKRYQAVSQEMDVSYGN